MPSWSVPFDASAATSLTQENPPARWIACDAATDRGSWNPKLHRFHDYWLAISPPGCLPGRQHFDPLDIADLMPRVWLLDVVREGAVLRFRYRLVGTKEVETLQREVTGQFLDEVQPHLRERPGSFDRYVQMVEQRCATYRHGPVGFVHHKDHRTVENCMVPFARDGVSVDMIAVCSVLYRLDGKEA